MNTAKLTHSKQRADNYEDMLVKQQTVELLRLLQISTKTTYICLLYSRIVWKINRPLVITDSLGGDDSSIFVSKVFSTAPL